MNWKFRELPSPEKIRPFTEALNVSPLMASVMLARGFESPADLSPPLELMAISGLDQAAETVLAAIRDKKRIRIHGDYDADGLTGTAVLILGLRELGANVHAFIPHRLTEGYGVYPDRVPEHIESCDLFVTVDCGISNAEEIRALTENGVSVVVTDHHSPGHELPQSILVHPMLTQALDKVVHPSGSGVAFLLLWKIFEKLGKPAPLEYADLAAIGTIADVVPLKGFNRALVQEGLRRLRASKHVGLAALAAEHCKEFNSMEVAFRIAPRINASSRLGEAESALKLLTTTDFSEARQMADYLSVLNSRRQEIEMAMLERVLPQIDSGQNAIVIHDSEGHAGVMGIVASRILEKFYKPVFIIAEGKGSVRSTPGISAVGGLRFAAETLKRFGGHAQAAGFAIADDQIENFRQKIYQYAKDFPVPVPEVLLEGDLAGEDPFEVLNAISLLEPLGEGNTEPLFSVAGKPENIRTMSQGKHLSFRINGLKGIKWRDNGENLPSEIEAACAVIANEWNGEVSAELRIAQYRAVDRANLKFQPVDFRLGLAEGALPGVKIYVAESGKSWFEEKGALVVSPEDATFWFSIPRTECIPASWVKVALSEKSIADVLEGDDFQKNIGRYVFHAYQQKNSRAFGAALEWWWKAIA